MAAWQVDFYVVPRRALAAPGDVAPGLPGAKGWTSHVFPSDYSRRLSAVASAAPASSAELQTWGAEGGNRVDVWSEGGRVSTVIAHVDVRKLDSKFGAALLQFVRIADAVLVRSDGLIVEPLVGAYAAALRSSDAWRFANDPAANLATYAEDDDDDD